MLTRGRAGLPHHEMLRMDEMDDRWEVSNRLRRGNDHYLVFPAGDCYEIVPARICANKSDIECPLRDLGKNHYAVVERNGQLDTGIARSKSTGDGGQKIFSGSQAPADGQLSGLRAPEIFQHRVKFGSLAEDPFGVIEYYVAGGCQGHATWQPVQQINTASLLEFPDLCRNGGLEIRNSFAAREMLLSLATL